MRRITKSLTSQTKVWKLTTLVSATQGKCIFSIAQIFQLAIVICQRLQLRALLMYNKITPIIVINYYFLCSSFVEFTELWFVCWINFWWKCSINQKFRFLKTHEEPQMLLLITKASKSPAISFFISIANS